MCTYSRGASRQSGVFLAVLAATMFVAGNLPAQTAAGYPQDWSHRHLVFSNPGTYEQAVQKGTADKWMKITSNPRYIIQQRARTATAAAATLAAPPTTAVRKTTLKKDWSTNLGGVVASLTRTIGTPGSGTVSSSSTLDVDSVLLSASPPATATISGTFSTEPSNNTSLTITNGSDSIVLTALSSGATGVCTSSGNPRTGSFSRTSYNSGGLTSLITSSNCGSSVGVTASGTGTTVTIKASAAGSSGNNITVKTSSSSFRISAWDSATNLAGGSDGTNSATTFAYWSGTTYASATQLASNLATAINANTTLQAVPTGVTASTSGSSLTITANQAGTGGNSYAVTPSGFSAFGTATVDLANGSNTPTGTVQPNAFPAKFSFSTTSASCSDYIVYPTGAAGAAGAADIIAYNNLYALGCSGTVPSIHWAYNTGGTVTTSPIISFDSTGSQVAFIQVSGSIASLVLLKWTASTTESITAPGAPTSEGTAAAYRSCSAATTPCMYILQLSGNHNDTFSSPYLDYDSDTLYVGDDSGNLHKFTGVFNGNPAEAGSPWPVSLGSKQLSSPVYDAGSGHVVLGDLGGTLHSVTGSTGAIFGTAALGDAIADAPLVDGSAGILFAFVTTSGSYSETGDNAVYEFSTSFTSLSNFPGVEPVGTGASGAGYYLYAGTFDNVYYQSTSHSGSIYVVGNTGTAGGGTLYRIPISSGGMTGFSAVVTGLNSTEHPWPSPATEFCNNGASACVSNGTATTSGTDYVFFSVNRGSASGCTNAASNGCILSYNVTNPATVSIAGTGLNVLTPGTNGCWATGGISIDNASTLSGASQIYFVNLNGNAAGNPTTPTSSNCTTGTTSVIDAVQAAQSNP